MVVELLRGRENIKGNEHFFREHNNVIFSAVKGCPKTTVVTGKCLLFLPPSQNQKNEHKQRFWPNRHYLLSILLWPFHMFLKRQYWLFKSIFVPLEYFKFSGLSVSLWPLSITPALRYFHGTSIALWCFHRFHNFVASSYYCNLLYYCSLMHHFGQTFLFFGEQIPVCQHYYCTPVWYYYRPYSLKPCSIILTLETFMAF